MLIARLFYSFSVALAKISYLLHNQWFATRRSA